MTRVRLAAAVAILGPLVAATASLALGPLNPSYDPIRISVSRLAAKGAPGAALMEVSIALVGASLLALSLGVWWARGWAARAVATLVAIAGVSFLVATMIQIDPAAPATVAGHRAASGVALASLVLAALAAAMTLDGPGRRYSRVSLVIGMVGLATLLSGVGLLFDGFPGGLWERALAVLTLCWAEMTAIRLLMPTPGLRPRRTERRPPAPPAVQPPHREASAGPVLEQTDWAPGPPR
jgi:hypothetical protein